MYLLVGLPFLTELIERGRWPDGPRGWATEIIAGLLVALLVRRVRTEHLSVLALTRTDPLTSLLNRRAFEQAVEEECARSRRSGLTLSLAFIDLDNFKLVNDRLGHDAGDRALRQLAAAIRASVRTRVDGSFRLGGDEFAVLMPGSSVVQAQVVMTRIREHCARSDRVWSDGSLTVSAGIVELAADEAGVDFVRRADLAMYGNKRAGARRRAG